MAEEKARKQVSKKKQKVTLTSGRAHILAGFNNTMITITDPDGNVLVQGGVGISGFKGSRKSTPYAASVAATKIGEKAAALGIRDIAVMVKGPGSGRLSSIKALKAAGLNITSIVDKTPIPHNGCRPKKRRRV